MKKMNHILFRSMRRIIPRGPGGGPVGIGLCTAGTQPGGIATPKTGGSVNLRGMLLALMVTMGSMLQAQDYTDKKSVSRSFPANMETTLEVENKYGKIKLVTWEKDSVAVEVDLALTESSSSKLRKLKEDVHIDFTSTNNYIIAKTVIESESGRIAKELRNLSNTLTGSNKRMEINYTVRVPEYLDVVLTNKFGDIYMDDLEGQLELNLSNGALKANRLTGNSSINLSFVDGTIKTLGSCTMSLSYSELELEEASQLDLDSKSSRLDADSINVLKINSRRDRFFFQQVEYLYGRGNFTQLSVYDFLRECDLYMKYGELTIEHVMPSFSKIYVESDYTDVSLFTDPQCNFTFDVLHHDKTVLRLPNDATVLEETYDGKDHYKTVGTLGDPGTESKITIDALQKSFINISIK